MLQTIKSLCFSTIMLFSFVFPAAYQFGHGSIPFGLGSLIELLWVPAPLVSFGGMVFGALLLVYGKNALRPWLTLVLCGPKPSGLEQAEAILILKTAQTLLLISCLIFAATHLIFALAKFNAGYEVAAGHVGAALACLINAGLISALVIVPVKAFWMSQVLPDDD